MIEVIHFQNRFGKQMVAVIGWKRSCTPDEKNYEQRYAAGLEKPYYQLPVQYDPAVGMSYAIQLSLYFIRRNLCDF